MTDSIWIASWTGKLSSEPVVDLEAGTIDGEPIEWIEYPLEDVDD